jgi:uncharacterized protein with beta-barrel porin domain
MPVILNPGQQVSATADVVFDTSAAPVAVTYLWSEASGGTVVTLNPTNEAAVAITAVGTADATVDITLVVTNPDGTSVETTDVVTVEAAVVTPPPPPPVTTPGDAISVTIVYGTPVTP